MNILPFVSTWVHIRVLVRVAHLFSFLCRVCLFCCCFFLRRVFRVPNVASVSGLSSSCVSCAQCCQCLGVVFVVCLVCPMLPVSRGCPFLIGAGSVYPFESPEFIPPVVSEVFLLSNYMFLAPCCVVMFAIMLGSPMHTYMCNMFFVFIYVYWLYTRYSYQKICRLKVTRRNCIP
jgi:hypothetical protein